MAFRITEKTGGIRIAANRIRLGIDLDSGVLEVADRRGNAVFAGTAGFTFASGEAVDPSAYPVHRWHERKTFGRLGEGREVTVCHSGHPDYPDLAQMVSVEEESPAFYVRTALSGEGKPSSASWRISGIDVLKVVMDRKQTGWLSPTRGQVVMMRQGTRMPSDRRMLVPLDHKAFPDVYECPGFDKWMRRESEETLEYISESLGWFTHRASGRSLFLGFVTQHDQATQLFVTRRKRAPEYLSIDCTCDIESNPVGGGQVLCSEQLKVDPFTGLEAALKEYVSEIRLRHGQPPPKPMGASWSTWSYYRKEASEAETIRNLDALKALGLPLDFIDINDGYYDAEDEWLGANERFPSGMKWMADEIRKRGWRASIWINPFVTRHDSRLSREHPEYLVKDRKGKPVRVRVYNLGLWEKENPICHPIDYTVPGARRWLRKVIHTLVHEWGYDRLGLDGPGRRYYVQEYFGKLPKAAREDFGDRGDLADPTVTSVRNIQIAYAIVRETAGDRAIVCGMGYFGPSYGSADQHLISQDWSSNWRVQLGHLRSSSLSFYPWPLRGGGTSVKLTRAPSPYWKGLPTLYNTVPEGQARIEWTRAAIGQGEGMSVRGKAYDLSAEELKLLHQYLPTWPAPTRRIDDPSASPLPTTTEKAVVASWGSWCLLGLTNYTGEDETHRNPVGKLTVPQDARFYHAWDFWRKEYLGRFTGTVEVTVAASDARLVSVRPAHDHPEILSTNMHYTQGAADLSNVRWDPKDLRLSFNSDFDYQVDVEIFVYVPPAYRVEAVDASGVEELSTSIEGEVLKLRYGRGGASRFGIRFGGSAK